MTKFSLRALALVLCLLVCPLAAQEVRTGGTLSDPERAYIEQLTETYGASERSRAANWTLADGTSYAQGVQVRFPQFQIDRMRFNTAEEAREYAASLPSSDFVEVRDNQVLRAFGPGRPGDADLRQGWEGLPSQAPAQQPAPAEQPAEAPASPAATSVPASTARSNGSVQLLRHHLLDEELPATSPGADPAPAQPAAEEPAAEEPLDPQEAFTRAHEQEQVQEELGSYMSDQARAAFDALTPAEQAEFAGLLRNHEDPAEQAYLLRSLGAGNSMEDLEWFSGQIEGRGAEWLDQNARLAGGQALTQQWHDSCAPTSSQVLRGELDPVYALRMRQAGDPYAVDPANPSAHNPTTAAEQRALLLREGGVAVSRDGFGGRGVSVQGYENLVDSAGERAGLDFRSVETDGVDDRRAGEILDANLRQGIPTPMAIYGPNSGHAVLAVDRREAADGSVDYQIYDPWHGTLTWVSRDDVNADTIDVGTNQANVGYVYEYVAPQAPATAQVAPRPVPVPAQVTPTQVEPMPVTTPQPYPSQTIELFPVPQLEPLQVEPLELEPVEFEPVELQPGQ